MTGKEVANLNFEMGYEIRAAADAIRYAVRYVERLKPSDEPPSPMELAVTLAGTLGRLERVGRKFHEAAQ